tara:strand:+ start:879 stop:1025 length:147 start_codon:yes stop_codon:yes gene_type:complete
MEKKKLWDMENIAEKIIMGGEKYYGKTIRGKTIWQKKKIMGGPKYYVK